MCKPASKRGRGRPRKNGDQEATSITSTSKLTGVAPAADMEGLDNLLSVAEAFERSQQPDFNDITHPGMTDISIFCPTPYLFVHGLPNCCIFWPGFGCCALEILVKICFFKKAFLSLFPNTGQHKNYGLAPGCCELPLTHNVILRRCAY